MIILYHWNSGVTCYCDTTQLICNIEKTVHYAFFVPLSHPLDLVGFTNTFQLVMRNKLNCCHKTHVFSI